MKKRILSFILVLVMTLGFLPTVSFAETKTYGDFTYDITEDEVTIIDCDQSVTTVDIPAEIEGYPVSSIGMRAFEDCSSLISVTIPSSMLSIENYAFEGCVSLSSIIIPKSVTWIFNGAFSGCDNLTTVNYCGSETDRANITIRTSNDDLLNATWVYNYGSTPTPDPKPPITINTCGDNLTWSFDQTTGTLTIDGTGDMYGYDSINGTYAPWYSIRDNITDVIIKEGVTSIGKEAFGFCRNLTNTTIPDSVVSIAESTFYGCTNLASVIIGNGVTSIGYGAFCGCENLVNVSLPENIETINGYTFYNCKKLTSIIIPEKVTAIGNCAFADCINLASINVPNSVVTIGDYSFSGCESLKEINLPNSVTSIGNAAFSDCTTIKSITIPENVVTIDNFAFSNCTSLESVNVLGNSTSIGDCVFEDCESLKDSDGFVIVKNILFDYYGDAENITIPEGVTYISWYVFRNYASLKNISISDSVTSVGSFAFYGCSNLESLTLPITVKSIGYNTFGECSSLSTVNYGGSESDRANITTDGTGNDALLNATWVYNYGSIPEPTPTPHTHSYTNACDTTCDCGYVRTTTHSFGEYVYNNDANEKADGTKTRTCSVCGHTETVTAVGTKWTASFTDIKAKDFYYKPTLWAVANNITTGTSKTTFSPNDACTRGQIVTFLWRAAGCPEPTTTNMPFTDVGNKAFYRKAVLWAVENGITSGTSKTTFSPNDPCTRGQIATFLWRAKGKPTPTSTNMPFNDVEQKGFYYKAVQWAVENKITSGTSKTTFAPSESCTRGQIVTFLYRAYN